jgi:hypothetical protein
LHFSKAPHLSSEEFKQRLVSDVLLELLFKPKQEPASMKALDLAARLTKGQGLKLLFPGGIFDTEIIAKEIV